MGLFTGNKREKFNKKLDKYNAIISFSCFSEQEGLPIPKQSLLGFVLLNDKVIIIDETNEFIIRKDSIVSINYSVDRKEEKKLESSISKGIIGGALFGVTGAIIGSQPKEKIVSSRSTSLLTLNYINSNGDNKNISISYNSIGDNTLVKMKSFSDKINNMISNYQQNQSIEL